MSPARRKTGGGAVLIYDGNCPVCKAAVKWIKENEKKGAFEFLPCRSKARRERFPLVTEELCMDAIQLVLPGGKVLPGEKAMPEILKRLKRYAAASDLFRLPGSDILSGTFYRWFADRRYRIARILFPRSNHKTRS